MKNDIENIKKYVRAANYLSVGQIYLQSNFLLKENLTFADIKTRLLGHWGTCPGINFTYACVNHLIKKTNANFLFVLGPGHGFPAIQANVFLEGTLGKYYPEAQKNEDGIAYIMRNFSWPYGFPSHSSPATPGVILEGGELGYSLATSYGAVLDNPDLIVTTLVGDGENETGASAAAWHLSKFIDPATNGAVLPILHLNGYKISGPTIFGRMKDADLLSLFKGYGYAPVIVEGHDDKIYPKMVAALEKAYKDIRTIQKAARKNPKKALTDFYHFPMIILKTPKGWTGVKTMKGHKMEGNYLSHQVVGKEMKTDAEELAALREWLKSYKFDELFNAEGFVKEIEANIPPEGKRMGDNPVAFGLKKGDHSRDLIQPDVTKLQKDIAAPGEIVAGAMHTIGAYLAEIVKLNNKARNFRLFSPDETYSNRLQDIFKETKRAFVGPIQKTDEDMARDGRVIEMLSEQSLQGLAQGYTITGRFSFFPSYESFIMVIASMADQYSKFLKIARKTAWRGDVPSLNYILSSTGWRQEHNGFSHQNPGFIDTILQKQHNFINVYFPADANEAVLVAQKCLESKNEINVIVAEKTFEPVWLTKEQARHEVEKGISIWDFASDTNPDVVFGASGQYLVIEALAAIQLLREEAPGVKTRFVNVLELSPNTIGHYQKITPDQFAEYFTTDKPVLFNFHGYPETIKQTLFDYENAQGRIEVFGYQESGSTTTPLDLHIRNKTDRYNLFIRAVERAAKNNVIAGDKANTLIAKYTKKIADHKKYILEFGQDPDEILNWKWKNEYKGKV